MPTFLVPQRLGPFIPRPGVGKFRPGSKIKWPDAHTKRLEAKGVKELPPSKYLIPLDQEGYKLLKKCFPKHDVAKPGSYKAPDTGKSLGRPMTPQEAADEVSALVEAEAPTEEAATDEKPKGKGRGKVRASDSE